MLNITQTKIKDIGKNTTKNSGGIRLTSGLRAGIIIEAIVIGLGTLCATGVICKTKKDTTPIQE